MDLDQKEQSVTGWVASRLGLEGSSRVEADVVFSIVTRNSIQRRIG